MALNGVIRALKNLTKKNGNSSVDDSEPTFFQEGEEEPDFFCVEDTFQSSDLSVSVEGIGELQFPVTDDQAKKLIEISSKAKFGRGEQTILDTSVRDTQVIPASMLDVKISEESLSTALERISRGLNIDKCDTLVPHLYNMLIYGPGQFFKMHRDSSKQTNMLATLVIVLPCDHKGGDLLIKHNSKKHVFFGSKNPNFVKCVVFYSDCQHQIKKVTEGFRIALTYNVVLRPSSDGFATETDQNLDEAINSYFAETGSEKMVYLLNHRYSENNLQWGLMKGLDRTYAYALLAIAKKQNRIPCLALSTFYEIFDIECEQEIETSTDLNFWIDEHDSKINSIQTDLTVSDDEVCCTIDTKESFDPYKTEDSGPTGNEGETRENWYRRGCVVIWSSKWKFAASYYNELNDLHELTTSAGNEGKITEVIKEAGSDFMNEEMWDNSDAAGKLIDIVMYINDPTKAELILSKLPNEMLSNVDRLLEVEKQFNKETLIKIISNWKSPSDSVFTKDRIPFIEQYVSRHYNALESAVVDFLIKKVVEYFINSRHVRRPYYSFYSNASMEDRSGRIDESLMQQICMLLELCVKLKKTSLQQRLIQHICTSLDEFKPLGLGELFLKLTNKMTLNECPALKILHQSALTKITDQISKLGNNTNTWNFDIKLSCNCCFCASLEAFLHSETRQKLEIPTNKQNRRHIHGQLDPWRGHPLKIHTERIGRPYKLVVEKESSYMAQRQKLLRDLQQVKQQLDVATIQLDDGSENQDVPNKRQKILTSDDVN